MTSEGARVVLADDPTQWDTARELQLGTNPSAWSVEAWQSARQSEVNRLWLVLNAGTVAGFLLESRVGSELEVLDMGVDLRFRRQGLAGRLLKTVFTDAAASGVDTVFLEVRVSNEGARTLYEHAGLVEIGRRRDYYRKPVEDAVLMRLDLAGKS